MRFTNATSATVRIWWLDRGQRRPYMTLSPFQSYEQSTYATHVWVATDDGGGCLALYVAEVLPANATVGLAAVPRVTPTPRPDVAGRVTTDRPDQTAASQIHFMYVLPSDGVDESLDVNGKIANAISAIQAWLGGQTGGRTLRIDTFNGVPDITFYRLSRSDKQISDFGSRVRDQIEAELKAAGFKAPDKLYAVIYGGSSTYSCGGGAWPPALPGNVAAMYLKGTPPGAPACATNAFGASATTPGYFEFGILHELLHTMGLVATCAPHHTLAGHASGDPRDLMYAGPLNWAPSILDVGHDDYYGHQIAGCPDLAKMPWLTP